MIDWVGRCNEAHEDFLIQGSWLVRAKRVLYKVVPCNQGSWALSGTGFVTRANFIITQLITMSSLIRGCWHQLQHCIIEMSRIHYHELTYWMISHMSSSCVASADSSVGELIVTSADISSNTVSTVRGNDSCVIFPWNVWYSDEMCDIPMKCVIFRWNVWYSDEMCDIPMKCVIFRWNVWWNVRWNVWECVIVLGVHYAHSKTLTQFKFHPIKQKIHATKTPSGFSILKSLSRGANNAIKKYITWV